MLYVERQLGNDGKAGRFAAGSADSAVALMHLLWDQMNAYHTGALWEKLNKDGTDVDANASLAHGWATGPVSSLSGYLLGARPVTAGYKTWMIAQQPAGDVKWAQGRIPTPSGSLVSRWRRDRNASFTLTMAAPEGTSGTVAIPGLGRSGTIAMDGRVVWRDGHPRRGVTAVERDGAVRFSGVTGSHTFSWAHDGITATATSPAATTGATTTGAAEAVRAVRRCGRPGRRCGTARASRPAPRRPAARRPARAS